MPSPLLTGLTEAWQLNETAGTRFAALGTDHLTEYAQNNPAAGNVGRVAGPGGVGFAAHFTASRLASLRCPDSPAVALAGASTGWHIWCWFKLDSSPTVSVYYSLMAKSGVTFGLEYELAVFNNSGSIFQLDFRGSPGGEFGKTITPDTSWHLAEAWWDPGSGTYNVALDGGAPTTQSGGNVTSRASGFSLGNNGNNLDYMDGAIAWPGIRKQVPSSADRALIWNGGAGQQYPFGTPPAGGTYTAQIDNTGGGAIPAGTPMPLFLPASFPWETVYWANGDDLTATDHAGAPLTVWPEIADRQNRYGRLWIAAPAVGAGAIVPINIVCGSPSQFSSANYDTVFSKRTANVHTVALYHCDTVATGSSPEASSGTALALTGSPTLAAGDGGNFRDRVPRQAFASGGYLTFNGTTQYGLVTGLLDTPPAAGQIAFRFKFEAAPPAGVTMLSKVAAFTGTTITDGLTLGMVTASGNPTMNLRIYKAGVLTEAVFEIGDAWDTDWHEAILSWGTQLTLRIDGIAYAVAPLTGAWNAGSAAPLCVGALYLAAASQFCNVSIDELEVRNIEPTRVETLTRFNRGGLPQTYEHDKWVRSGPILTPTLTAEQGAVFEPRAVRVGLNSYVGEYTGGVAVSQLFGMTSTNGLAWTKTGAPIMGHGVGGHAGDACRGNIFRDPDDGSMHLYFSDSIPTTGGTIWHATSTDNGATWTRQAALIAPDANHLGWAGSSVVKIGSTYHWLLEYRAAVYLLAYGTSTSLAGPITLIDDVLPNRTLRTGTGQNAQGGIIADGTGKIHSFPHMARFLNLPSTIYHAVSDDLRRWDLRGGGDPIIDLEEQASMPRQDQSADPHCLYSPELGKVVLLYDIDDNHGGGYSASICAASFTGALTDLDSEFPNVSLVASGGGGGGGSGSGPAASLLI